MLLKMVLCNSGEDNAWFVMFRNKSNEEAPNKNNSKCCKFTHNKKRRQIITYVIVVSLPQQ